MHKRGLLLIAAIGVFVAGDAAAREGFGFTKKAVTMTRTIPPATNLGARRVKVVATTERASAKDDAAALKLHLEEAVLAGAGTIAPSEKGDTKRSAAIRSGTTRKRSTSPRMTTTRSTRPSM